MNSEFLKKQLIDLRKTIIESIKNHVNKIDIKEIDLSEYCNIKLCIWTDKYKMYDDINILYSDKVLIQSIYERFYTLTYEKINTITLIEILKLIE